MFIKIEQQIVQKSDKIYTVREITKYIKASSLIFEIFQIQIRNLILHKPIFTKKMYFWAFWVLCLDWERASQMESSGHLNFKVATLLASLAVKQVSTKLWCTLTLVFYYISHNIVTPSKTWQLYWVAFRLTRSNLKTYNLV